MQFDDDESGAAGGNAENNFSSGGVVDGPEAEEDEPSEIDLGEMVDNLNLF